jgi:hypothetical protein
MADPNDQKPASQDTEQADGPAPSQDDGPNVRSKSDPSGRDFGDSAGYGGGGSTRDYQEVVGENPVTAGRPNPLDAVIPAEPSDNKP